MFIKQIKAGEVLFDKYETLQLILSTWWLSIKLLIIFLALLTTPKIQLLYQNF